MNFAVVDFGAVEASLLTVITIATFLNEISLLPVISAVPSSGLLVKVKPKSSSVISSDKPDFLESVVGFIAHANSIGLVPVAEILLPV